MIGDANPHRQKKRLNNSRSDTQAQIMRNKYTHKHGKKDIKTNKQTLKHTGTERDRDKAHINAQSQTHKHPKTDTKTGNRTIRHK